MIRAYKGLNTYCSKLGYGRQDKLYGLVLRFVAHTECRLVTDQHNQLVPEAASLSWIALSPGQVINGILIILSQEYWTCH